MTKAKWGRGGKRREKERNKVDSLTMGIFDNW